jgi:hypothetical protein
MEYHSYKFMDQSLLFYRDNEFVALLPANIINSVLHSHGGLTFGGVISEKVLSQTLMLEIR